MAGSSMMMQLAGLFSYYNLLLLLEGLVATFVLSIIGCLAGFVAGFAVAVLRVTRSRSKKTMRSMSLE